VNVQIAFVSVPTFIAIVTNMSDSKVLSNLGCANARLKRKLVLKQKKMKCAQKTQSLLLDEEQRKKRNFTPLYDIIMNAFLNQDTPTHNDISGYYKGQPPQRRTNEMNHRLFHQSSHRQNLFRKFEVVGSIGQSSFQRVLKDTTICPSTSTPIENMGTGSSF